jgi:ferritin
MPQIYLSYGAWADNNGFSGIANFLPSCCRGTKSHDENAGIHIKQRCKAIPAIPAPTTDPVTVNDCFEVFEHEVDNTKPFIKW